jgi:Predicted membrane protein
MKTHYISAGAIFGTMAVVVRILGIKLPFPPIPYLTFEFAEIPIILGFLFYGPAVGLVSVFSYWIILNVVGSFVPIGPAMAFAASLSTICGIWVGLKAAGRLGFSKDLAITLGFIIGSTFRITVMSFFNYIIFMCSYAKLLRLRLKESVNIFRRKLLKPSLCANTYFHIHCHI